MNRLEVFASLFVDGLAVWLQRVLPDDLAAIVVRVRSEVVVEETGHHVVTLPEVVTLNNDTVKVRIL
jgi:hypothetical protein